MSRAEHRSGGVTRSPPNRSDRHVEPILLICIALGQDGTLARRRPIGPRTEGQPGVGRPGVSTLVDRSCNLFGVRQAWLTVGKPACQWRATASTGAV